MTSNVLRILAGAAIAATTLLTVHTGPLGATPADGHIVTFQVTADGQTPTAVEPATIPTDAAGNAAAYDRLVAVADTARAGCGTYQVDLFDSSAPIPVVGELYPPNTSGTLSAIPEFPGTGTCTTDSTITPPPATTSPPPVAAPPVEQAQDLTSATVAPEAVNPVTPVVPAVPVTSETSSSDVGITKTTVASARSAALPTTGTSDSAPLAAAAGGLLAMGAATIVLGRRFAR